MIEVGITEAKDQFSEIMKRVEDGEEFLIMNDGKPVARVVPPPRSMNDNAKNAIQDFLYLKKHHPIGTLEEIAEWKNEGRA